MVFQRNWYEREWPPIEDFIVCETLRNPLGPLHPTSFSQLMLNPGPASYAGFRESLSV